jgi:hypothetical protein
MASNLKNPDKWYKLNGHCTEQEAGAQVPLQIARVAAHEVED